MTTPPPRRVDDPAELAEFFGDAPAAHIYALVDLEEPFWSASEWFREGEAVVGLVTLPDGFRTAYAVSTRDPEGSLDLLAALDPHLASGMQITGPVGLVTRMAELRKLAWDSPHERYHLADPARLPDSDQRVRPLDPQHVGELAALFAHEPGAVFFRAEMVDYRSFVGIYEGAGLVAAAGTHVLSERSGLAALGAVYTIPSHRGRGLGRAVTAGVCQRIAPRIGTIGLNVAADNVAARALYESMGFVPVLAYEEVEIA